MYSPLSQSNPATSPIRFDVTSGNYSSALTFAQQQLEEAYRKMAAMSKVTMPRNFDAMADYTV